MPPAPEPPQIRTPSPEHPIRAVIDTSVWLPKLTSPRPRNGWILRLARKHLIIPMGNRETDAELLEELREHYAPEHGINAYLLARYAYGHYDQYREVVTALPSEPTPRCEDRNDQMFVDLAYASGAEILLARDHKLLELNGLTPFPIVHDQIARQALDQD